MLLCQCKHDISVPSSGARPLQYGHSRASSMKTLATPFQSPQAGQGLCNQMILVTLDTYAIDISVPSSGARPLQSTYLLTSTLCGWLISVPSSGARPLQSDSVCLSSLCCNFSPLKRGKASAILANWTLTTVHAFQSPQAGQGLCNHVPCWNTNALYTNFSPLKRGKASAISHV